MKKTDHYLKIVEWSEEDHCYIGQCPGVIGPCCHGDDEVKVYEQLCGILEDWIMLAEADGEPLPPATASRHLAEAG